MTFWCVQNKTLTPQLHVEEAPQRKCDVLNHRATMKCHLISRKDPEVVILASQFYAHDHDDQNCDGNCVAVLACLIWPLWVSQHRSQ